MPRATTAAWLVIPPRVVSTPLAACMPWMSSGLVSMRTRITASPRAANDSASSAENTILPEAAPGDAGNPRASTVVFADGIEHRMQQLVQRPGFDPADRLLAIDHPFLDQRHRDLQRGLRGALAGARLQHPQLAALNGELDVLHVAVVVFEFPAHLVEFAEHLGHDLFHRRQSRVVRLLAGDRQMLRGADPGHDILALRIYQELAVKRVGAGRRVAGEGDAGRAIRPHIAEHHRLHVDRGSPVGRDVVQPAIGDRARVHPGAEHRADRAPQLLWGPAGRDARVPG